jgi:hypothetical protein
MKNSLNLNKKLALLFATLMLSVPTTPLSHAAAVGLGTAAGVAVVGTAIGVSTHRRHKREREENGGLTNKEMRKQGERESKRYKKDEPVKSTNKVANSSSKQAMQQKLQKHKATLKDHQLKLKQNKSNPAQASKYKAAIAELKSVIKDLEVKIKRLS